MYHFLTNVRSKKMCFKKYKWNKYFIENWGHRRFEQITNAFILACKKVSVPRLQSVHIIRF